MTAFTHIPNTQTHTHTHTQTWGYGTEVALAFVSDLGQLEVHYAIVRDGKMKQRRDRGRRVER